MPVLLLLFWGRVEATKRVTVEGFRYWSGEKYTRIVIDLDSPVGFTQNRLSNPDRLYFDLENSLLSKKATPFITIEDGILRSVRAGQFNKETVRVVLDLQEVKSFSVFMLEDPSRLVIDVFGKKELISIPEKEKKIWIKRVVIDPGHGGKDPGAIGPTGLMEKDVVLAIAKKLREVLMEKHNIEVILTRDMDVFVPLEQRAAIANSKNADVFISIHANANPRERVKGIETYILNWTTDEESMRVAARENAISFSKLKKAQSELQMILQDLARDNKKDESMRLAHNVQGSMVDILKQDYNEIVDLGVKQALFYVLVGADMPSILIETSFISNYEEEELLSQVSYREKIAEAIAKGIKDYSIPSKFVKKISDNI